MANPVAVVEDFDTTIHEELSFVVEGRSMERFAEALHPDEVTAGIGLIDRMPQLLDHVENDVLPALQSLDRVGPDLHEVLEIVEDLRRVITGLPGIGLLRRRGEDEPPPVEGSVHEGDSSADRRKTS